jgi:hypothetical protein
MDVVEDFMTALIERNLYKGITGYRKRPEDGQGFVINTKKGDISLQIAEIAQRDYAFPISRAEYDSGRYSHFIAKAPGEIPLAINNNRLSTSIQRTVREQLEAQVSNSEPEMIWLLVYSTSGYPEADCCVRGNKMDGQAVSMARDYLNNHEQAIFDQIWYTNLVTLPVRIWPHNTGQLR